MPLGVENRMQLFVRAVMCEHSCVPFFFLEGYEPW
jgi:hypothetical protein